MHPFGTTANHPRSGPYPMSAPTAATHQPLPATVPSQQRSARPSIQHCPSDQPCDHAPHHPIDRMVTMPVGTGGWVDPPGTPRRHMADNGAFWSVRVRGNDLQHLGDRREGPFFGPELPLSGAEPQAPTHQRPGGSPTTSSSAAPVGAPCGSRPCRPRRGCGVGLATERIWLFSCRVIACLGYFGWASRVAIKGSRHQVQMSYTGKAAYIPAYSRRGCRRPHGGTCEAPGL